MMQCAILRHAMRVEFLLVEKIVEKFYTKFLESL